MTKLVGLHPEDVVPGTTWCYPTSNAPRCPSPDEGYQTQPAVNGVPPATKVFFDVNYRSEHRRTPQSRGIVINDYAGRNISARNYWKFNSYPSPAGAMPLTTYSCRFYASTGAYPSNFIWTGCFPHLITFMEAGESNFTASADRFSLMLTDWQLFNFYQFSNAPFVKGETNAINLSTGDFFYQMNGATTYRIEIQVKPTAPKVTINIYLWNATTPWYTITCSPNNIAADCFMLGRHPLKCGGSAFVNNWWIGDLEIFDTYNLDGTAGQHYETPRNQWFELIDGIEVPVAEEGTKLAGVINTTDKNNWSDKKREYQLADSAFTSNNVYYDSPSRPWRPMTLWVPTRTPPPNGWPLVIWVHGGFFSAGDRNQVHLGWVKKLLRQGYAVASINYIYAWQLSLYNIAKPAWPEQGSGLFPSFVTDAKLAGLWAYNQTTYPIDETRQVICGHSAGAYLAHAAAISRDLNNLNGRDLTVNNQWGYRTGTADPIFKGVYGWSTPSDLWWAYNNDPTHPDFGPAIGTQYGALKVTANLFYGKTAFHTLLESETTGSSLAEMIAAQSKPKIPKIGLCHGKFDGVVPPNHIWLYQAALAAKGLSADVFMSNKAHETCYDEFPERHFEYFLDSLW